ncbi:RNA-binding protein Pasilla-like [Bolinopsis microptera]|uniref:RNA-binding protein Pasilla-like n=1 Tax=Bolinopsis microptera TaxID=2820187 RepID=UPI00307903DC
MSEEDKVAQTADAVTNDAVTTDAMTTDAVTSDAVTTDAVTTDAVTTDAGTTDAVTTDAVTTDAVTTDAVTAEAVTAEAVATDAETAEAVATDAVTAEAETTDAVTTDAVTIDPESVTEEAMANEPDNCAAATSSTPQVDSSPAPDASKSEKQAESNEPSGNKRAAEELEPEEKCKKPKTENLLVFKMLCPFWCAGAVIGTKGEHIRQLKEETGCVIRITKNHENFPMTSERVVSIRGEEESIKKVILAVQNKIRNDRPPPNAPSKDNSKRKGCMKLVVSVSSAGRIIGKGGEQTKKLQTLHGVHVDVMKTADLPPGLKESVVTISGDDNDKVDNCMTDVLALVSEDKRANLNYNVDYSSFGQNKQHSGPVARQPNQYGGWGGAPQSAPQPHYYPPQWGGNYGNHQPYNQNYRDHHARGGNRR